GRTHRGSSRHLEALGPEPIRPRGRDPEHRAHEPWLLRDPGAPVARERPNRSGGAARTDRRPNRDYWRRSRDDSAPALRAARAVPDRISLRGRTTRARRLRSPAIAPGGRPEAPLTGRTGTGRSSYWQHPS